jgi:hypothetical protein
LTVVRFNFFTEKLTFLKYEFLIYLFQTTTSKIQILFTETSSAAAATTAAANGAIAVQGALWQGGFPEAPYID